MYCKVSDGITSGHKELSNGVFKVILLMILKHTLLSVQTNAHSVQRLSNNMLHRHWAFKYYHANACAYA